jgi:phage terminase small subunit
MGKKPDKTPSPPAHLSKRMKKFWISIFDSKTLKPHETLIFVKACEAHDRAEQARRVLKREGLIFTDRFDQPRSRPEITIERDSRAAFAKLLAQIHLYEVELFPFLK